MGLGDGGQMLGSTGSQHSSAAVAALGAHVDQPVSALDDVEVVLDCNDGIALINQALNHAQELADILKVQTGGGFIQHIDGSAVGALLQFGGQLDALSLTTGEGGR